ncbi:head morphogenesis protein [Roseobacter sp. HKCCD9010]|uniref:phage head morphogenesis protein n=1 Tax=unclassified Roseobacter TaxID=196798 RepID=UPI0014929EE8|nr:MULTISPECIES: phage minor head protein [unclassified Roseobacter]MBF9049894.1 head morphogenesis protein [Rhodobacterales bacterium HKCCD4356]NNV13567.1 head morphogenesis protein [Roseobacter sp. HKCCD7357]NNV16401.1 head morphogenesis protein [Roseobacter sp. HKCCD8768]NNV25860.1 head morphogenesis protein [Roseobacter sp. HKCCD8192]NNV30118.1 head morphogenesis protein [Roseobacter sp. HKCCD9061]
MTEFSDKPGYAFNPGAPPEVASFFRNKGLRPSFDWQDVEPEEHAVAFSVAKAMQVDVLEAIQGALQEAIDEGIPYEQFAKDLKPRLRKLGWWGVKEQVDPVTGDVRKVRLGSPRRLKTIYRANIRSARAAGQWDRIQRTKDALPYLIYLLGPSENHRPHHEAKEGLVLPVDDPFWQSWYPPNGWGCKCHVRQITRREAERRGISDSPEIPMREVFNRRTGEIKRIPSGIDPGWEMNPGLYRQRQMERFLTGKLDAADPAVAGAAARDMAASWRLRRIHEGSAKGAVPVAVLPDELASAISARTRVVQFSDYTAEKTRRKHGEATAEEFVRVADLLETGSVAREVSSTGTESLIIEGGADRRWRLVLKRTVVGDEIFLSTFHRTTLAKWRRLLERDGVDLVRE